MSVARPAMSDRDSKLHPDGEPNLSGSEWDESLPPRAPVPELTWSGLGAAAEPPSSDLSWAPGDLLANRFRIIRFISKGGMGEVYEAEDLELRERVAIKTILPSIAANPAAIEQFKREIQLARRVTHPNVCRIFDLVYDPRPSGPVAFLTMELLNGVTLAAYLEKSGSISLDETIGLARQIAEGLDAAHRVGVIHRDFKPGNVILVDADEKGQRRAVVTDFGLAFSARAAESDAGRHGGTPTYMAPEQIRGETVSAAADIYAFGVTLYELTTGHWPYTAKTLEELRRKKLSQAPVPPSKYAPDLPVRVERVIFRCLAKSPEERFAHATDAVAALEPHRSRWQLLVAAAVILVAMGSIAGYEWRRLHRMAAEPTVAVVGFRNDTGNTKDDWLATELSESLTTDLGGSRGIHAVSTDEIASVKTELSAGQTQTLEHEDLSSVRQALGADYLVLGRYAVLLQGSSLDLNILLQDSRGETAGEIHESGSAGEYRKLIADAASQIRDKLGSARLSDSELSELQNLYPADAEASQLYFQGLDKLRSFDAPTGLSLLKKAADRDPDNVSIHWGLSDAWAQLKHDPEAAQEAQKAATLAENAGLPQEYVVLAQARAAEMNKQWDAGVDDYKSLFRLFPQHLNYGLRLALVQIEGSKPTDGLATLDTLGKLPAPMGTDPRIEMAKARAYGTMGDYNSELRAAQASLQEAQRRNARMMQARAQLEMCWAHRNLGHVDEAFAACNEAQNLFSVFGDNVSAAVALNNVATWLFDRSRYVEAKQLYDRVIQVNQAAGAQKDLAGACVNAARTAARMGRPEEAQEYLKRALHAAGPIGDKYDEALARILGGVVLAEQGHLSDAKGEEQKALVLGREIKNAFLEATALGDLAEYQSETDARRGLATYLEALRLVRHEGDQSGLATCLTNMGDVQFRLGDIAGAEKSYQAALQIDTQLKDKNALAHDWLSLGEVDFERRRLPDAEDKATQAIEEFHEDQDADSESQATSLLVKVLLSLGRNAEAEPYVRRIQEIASKDRESQFDGRLSDAEYLNAVGKREEAIRQIESVPADAKNAGMNFASLNARLTLVKIQVGLRPREELRKELSSIQVEAHHAGFGLLVQRARGIRL
jgi:eukaryotic-like serine/threonine-protein kinase